jgi:RHS repeat-associated protein
MKRLDVYQAAAVEDRPAREMRHWLLERTNNALVQTFNVNSLNQLTTGARSGTLTVAGGVSTEPTSVTVKDNSNSPAAATVYEDNTFARQNVTLLDGNNTFTAVAEDASGRKDTNSVTAHLPASPAYTYDARGNLVSDGRRGFDYDDENQLVRVTATNGWKSEFAYDGMMRRRVRKEFTWSSAIGNWQLTNEVRYVYDGRLVVQERNSSNVPLVTLASQALRDGCPKQDVSLTRHAVTRGNDLSGTRETAGGIGGMLARTDNTRLLVSSAGAHAYYHADGNGNVTALVNENQLLVANYHYDPFGNTLSAKGPLAEANLYRFSSKEVHANSGLVYYLYRYYEPSLQRWMNRDLLGESGGFNLFGFAFNNPLQFIDPFGLSFGAPGDLFTDPKNPELGIDFGKFLEKCKDGLWDLYKDHEEVKNITDNLLDPDTWKDNKGKAVGLGLAAGAAAGLIGENLFDNGKKLETPDVRLFKGDNWKCTANCWIQKSPDGGVDCGINFKFNLKW